jgi:hypothetical protein
MSRGDGSVGFGVFVRSRRPNRTKSRGSFGRTSQDAGNEARLNCYADAPKPTLARSLTAILSVDSPNLDSLAAPDVVGIASRTLVARGLAQVLIGARVARLLCRSGWKQFLLSSAKQKLCSPLTTGTQHRCGESALLADVGYVPRRQSSACAELRSTHATGEATRTLETPRIKASPQ